METDGNTGGLLLTGGVQVDLASNIHLGATITSPGLRVSGSSLVIYQFTQFSGDGSRDLFFRDPEATFDYKFPLKATVGASITFGKAEIEADLRYHGSRDTYVIFDSDIPGHDHHHRRGRGADGRATPRSRTSSRTPRPSTTSRSAATTHSHPAFECTRDSSPTTRRSTIPETSLFRQLDLTGFSGGVSFGAGRLQASAGLSSSRGTSEERLVGPSLGGVTSTTRIEVTTYNLLYAISFAF